LKRDTLCKSTSDNRTLVSFSSCKVSPSCDILQVHPVFNRTHLLLLLICCRASLAGITALPTDPAVLLQLGPLANSLASALPTSSVLSVLLTAAPSGFVSSIVNDPSYAASFESAFSAGKSPSWFNGLPTDVRSYLHTYSGFGGLATAAGAIKDVTSSAGSEAGAAGTTASSAGSAASGAMSSSASGASNSASSASSGMSMSATSMASTEGSTPSSAAPVATGSSAPSSGGAAHPIGTIAIGLAGVLGIMGIAVAL